ncbi:MAG: alpha/beta fold hydrolase [Streptosporangiaceae bacterium]|nr:alpha/beta fold hydrolase [Streptosporangiaceae bacterium]
MKRWVRIGSFGLTALAVAAGCVIPNGIAASASASASPAVPALAWQPCDSGFECATARVPLDYNDPHGRMIDIAVIRHLATDPADRLGSLFFNPGGPGGSGTQALPLYYSLFPAQVRARFDIVSFDPRGVPNSTAVQCYPSLAAEQQALAGVPTGFPVGQTQIQTWDRVVAGFDRACGASAADLLPHLSTANVARDMDLLRQAVGDPRLNYLGISYGTFLGATYANLFPGKVRAMVLDGNIDPVAYSTGYGDEAKRLGVVLRIRQDEGMAATLNAFLTLCGQATPGACAFSAGSAAATQDKYQALLGRLAKQPVTISGRTFTYASTTVLVGPSLYATEPQPGLPGWAALATFLQELWTATGGGSSASAPMPVARPGALPVIDPLPAARNVTAPAAAQAYTGIEQGIATVCDDVPNPRDVDSYPLQAAFGYARSGAFGVWRAWGVEPCAHWPAVDADRYSGPWNHPTASPVLVVGNTIDPGTPYQGSLAMVRDLARSRLLTVDGYGHTVFLNPSSCAQAYESAYLIAGTLPPAGTTCQPDQLPFS